MDEIQEIAYQIINEASVNQLQKWKTIGDIYQDIVKSEKDTIEPHKAYDLAVEIADILFIQQKQ